MKKDVKPAEKPAQPYASIGPHSTMLGPLASRATDETDDACRDYHPDRQAAHAGFQQQTQPEGCADYLNLAKDHSDNGPLL